MLMKNKIVYIDLDNVLVDFPSAFKKIPPDILEQYMDNEDEIPDIFSLMDPMKGALEAFDFISEHADTYILSTAPWKNPTAWSDKLLWVKQYLGDKAHKRLILTHHKNLNKGDILIDDREKNGAKDFSGELIKFGSDDYPDWEAVVGYLRKIL
jgi:5'-nucleotidase